MKPTPVLNKLLEMQTNALREPAEVICGNYAVNGIFPESLEYKADAAFLSILEKLKITLLVTREYEHLVIALNVKKNKLRQSFIHLPHPSGIALDVKTNKVYVAATRNPNQVVELAIASGKEKYLIPSRVKYFGGAYYFHDLAFINGELYANSVGKNSIIKVDFNSSYSDKAVWSPLPAKVNSRNHLQLNSIAAGKSLADSYFSASAEKPGKYKPGDLKFPVDKMGVIFHGKTNKVIARGLTRPHSARLYKDKLWVDNSGYGEFGSIENGKFSSFAKLPGWTRGLCFKDNVAFVGVSKVIQKFKVYAPGIKEKKQQCGVYAIDMTTKKIIGHIEWAYGNQIFGLETIASDACEGFLYTNVNPSTEQEINFFSNYTI
jgi:uncharacterized protein (TIGR03032 family)